MIDPHLMSVIESALAEGARVQLKQQKDGTVKAQIISAKELKPQYQYQHPQRN